MPQAGEWIMEDSDSYILESQIGFVMRRVVQRHIAIFSFSDCGFDADAVCRTCQTV